MTNKRPNILFVFPDQYRLQALGFRGDDPVYTPNLDAFAAESRVLTHAVSTRPVCSPYRAMLLTGQYPHQNGVVVNCNSNTSALGNYLKESTVCLSDVLAEAGYSQGYIGKWHLDPPNPDHNAYTEGPRGSGGVIWDTYTPPNRRHQFDFWHSYGCCDRHFNPHYWTTGAALHERIEPQEWSVKHETDVAVDYIRNANGERDPAKPFSLVISHNPPHPPYQQVPPRYLERYEDMPLETLANRANFDAHTFRGEEAAARTMRQYFAAVTGVDEQFGRMLRALDEEGLRENTIVVFTADHGDMMGSHGRIGKDLWYAESFRVPFIVRWPGRLAEGEDDLLIGTPDLTPTLLGLTGEAGRIPDEVQGTNYAPALLGGKQARPTSALYWTAGAGGGGNGVQRRGILTHRHTFVVQRRGEEEQIILHDDNADPYQLRNAADANADLVESLRAELWERLQEIEDPWAV